MKKTKIFAAYLPQYHETPENNLFWGKGFTDWVGVKNAKPQFDGHQQPVVPLNKNYYDLSQTETLRWQASLANTYKVDGFNIYHYWFKDGKKMLETPAENLLANTDINIEYYFTWDNSSWVRSWGNIRENAWAPAFDTQAGQGKKTLLQFEYGDKVVWKQHFEYLCPFFLDGRYFKIQGKPVFAFMKTRDAKVLHEMCSYWDSLAKEQGFSGMYFLTSKRIFLNKCILDGQFMYQPNYSGWGRREALEGRLERYFHIKPKRDEPVKYRLDYEKIWENILEATNHANRKNEFYGAIVGFDDTPRRGKNARILVGKSPSAFEKYFKNLYKISCEQEKEFMLITAWNEWGEGAYLEPDTENGYAYLEALKRAVESVDAENV